MGENILIALISAGAVLLGTVIAIVGQIIGNIITHNSSIKQIKTSIATKEKIASLKNTNLYLEKGSHKLFFLIKELKDTSSEKEIKNIFQKIKKEAEKHDKEFSTTCLIIFNSKKIFDEYLEHCNIIKRIKTLAEKKNINNEESKKTAFKLIKKLMDKNLDILSEMKKEIGINR